MKKILFVINTLGKAGAEVALMELLRRLLMAEDPEGKPQYEVCLYVLTGQGEMIKELPEGVKLLNQDYDDCSVLSARGRKKLTRTVMKAFFKRGNLIRLFPYLCSNLIAMQKKGEIKTDKLLWRLLSDSGERFTEEFDLAVAYLEGGSTYYVAEHVKAKKKAAFVHVDYSRAGYTRKLDRDAYRKLDRIFAVSGEVRDSLLAVYPECEDETFVFHNLLNAERILQKSKEEGGFRDGFTGTRILTVGRLEKQKALEVSIAAMKILKDRNIRARWYVLGEGSERKVLESEIERLGLKEDFLLCGAVENPYPYMAQADLYVHASRFEGKSIAIQEAQILGKTIIVSDCSGNREQVRNGIDGVMVELRAEEIADCIERLMGDKGFREKLAENAAKVNKDDETALSVLTGFMEW